MTVGEHVREIVAGVALGRFLEGQVRALVLDITPERVTLLGTAAPLCAASLFDQNQAYGTNGQLFS